MKIGVIGHGFVGRAVASYFRRDHDVLVYDKATSKPEEMLLLCANSFLIFVCVPTPMNPDGTCHTDIVESVLDEVKKHQKANPVIVIKSTVSPGFTKRMAMRTGLRLVFSPEFLTEKNAEKDFAEGPRTVAGGDPADVSVLFRALRLSRHPGQMVSVSDPTEAELCKLYTNAFLMTKVLLANEVALIAEGLGLSYERVAGLMALDPRIGASHLTVPGHDGFRGAGGHCLPKDVENLRSVARALGTREKLLSTVLERNKELREERDWELMKGRAVL